MTKITTIIIASTVFAAGFATAAQAQGVRAPDIYAPSYGVGYGSSGPTIYTAPSYQSLGAQIREQQDIYRAFSGGARPCVPAAGDRC